MRTVVQRGFVNSFGDDDAEGEDGGGGGQSSATVLGAMQNNRLLLKFCTDKRSNKVGELAACDKVEACWYFASHEQIRLKGNMMVRVLPLASATNFPLAVWSGVTPA